MPPEASKNGAFPIRRVLLTDSKGHPTVTSERFQSRVRTASPYDLNAIAQERRQRATSPRAVTRPSSPYSLRLETSLATVRAKRGLI